MLRLAYRMGGIASVQAVQQELNEIDSTSLLTLNRGEQGLETLEGVPPTLGLCEASLANAVSSSNQLRHVRGTLYPL